MEKIQFIIPPKEVLSRRKLEDILWSFRAGSVKTGSEASKDEKK